MSSAVNDTNGLASGSGIANNKSLPQSPASMVSSESETQSISDEQIAVRSTSKTSRKSSKEERPPWRTVIIAPPQKVNKNALLKAKILDATRRALLAQKINHVATQTDAYATILREKATDVQKDLILMLDKSADTDGTITIRKDRPGGLIITQTVGQMTDRMPSITIGTQTPLPRTHLSFASLAASNDQDQRKSSPFEKQMLENELLLQTQRNALKIIDAKLNGTHFNDRRQDKDEASYENITLNDEQQESSSQIHSPSLPPRTTYHVKVDGIAMKMRENALRSEPFNCWDDFDFADTENELPELPRRTVSDGSTPWNNFKDLLIGQRVTSMTLTPVENRPKTSTKKKSVTWNERQLAVTKLIHEASALIDIFNEVSVMIGPEIDLKLPKNEMNPSAISIPKSKWQPILKESCDDLRKSLSNFKPQHHLSSAQLLNRVSN